MPTIYNSIAQKVKVQIPKSFTTVVHQLIKEPSANEGAVGGLFFVSSERSRRVGTSVYTPTEASGQKVIRTNL